MAFEDICIEGLCGESLKGLFIGGAIGAVIAIGILFLLLLIIALYVYTAFTWMTIAKKLGYKKAWLAWIPIANICLVLELGGYHWAWVFLILIPILGWIALFIFVIVATWKIFERRKYPGWFSLSMVIPKIGGILYLVAIGFVAWKDKVMRKKETTTKPTPAKKARKPVKRKTTKKR